MSGPLWTQDLMWWITVVELPALAGLFLLIWRTRRDLETAVGETAEDRPPDHGAVAAIVSDSSNPMV